MIKLKEALKNNKTKLIVILGIIGIVFILISEIFSDNNPEDQVQNKTEASADFNNYVSETEEKLRKMLCKIDGVGKAEVMVTAKGTEEYIYAKQEKVKNNDKDISTENEYVIIGSGSEKQALLEKINSPQIVGIVVICEGGDSNIVKERIYESLNAAFDIPSSSIYVTKLDENQ